MKTKRTYNNAEAEITMKPFGIADEKGRWIGVRVRVTPVKIEEVPADTKTYYVDGPAPGEYLALNCHATRNGKTFGPVQRDSFYTTRRDLDAALSKYCLAAMKRASKKALKVPAP